MKTKFSKSFIKQADKLSGKIRQSFQEMVADVESASSLHEIANCKKLSGYKNAYRIRLGDYRAIFLFIVVDGVVYFQYLLPRGEAYNKEYLKNLF